MDPLTLLALANGAVAAVKKGCQLYKDIKGAAGDVRGVLEDLEQQFKKNTEGKTVSKEYKQQYEEKRKEIIDASKKDPNDIITVIADQLGEFFDAMDKIEHLFWEEERASSVVYKGDVSLSRRALQRVLIRSRLEQMHVELREQMIYHVPPELKDLWTRFQDMREQITKEQNVARIKQEAEDAIKARNRKQLREKYTFEIGMIIAIIFVSIFLGLFFMWLSNDRKERWPELNEPGTYRKQLEKLRQQDIEKIRQTMRYLDEKNYEK